MVKRDIFNKENLISFILNFLAVVLGIVITFGGESIISHKEERDNLNNCLELVSSELQNDRDCLSYCDTLVRREIEAASFLVKYEENYSDAPTDSLYAFANIPLIIEKINIYTDAFELLKNSGVLTKIRDKKLALQIFQTYDSLNDIVTYLTAFYDHKTKYLEPALNDNVKLILARDNVSAVDFWSAVTATTEGQQFLLEVLRFLSSYDPSEVYGMIDNTIGLIQCY